jgi:hypothetical protein
LTTQTNQIKHGYKSAARSLASLVDTNLGKDEVDWIYNAVMENEKAIADAIDFAVSQGSRF